MNFFAEVAAYPDQFKLTVGMEELPDAAALMIGPPGSGTLPEVAALAAPGNAVTAAAHMRAAAVKAVAHNRLVSIDSPSVRDRMHQACPGLPSASRAGGYSSFHSPPRSWAYLRCLRSGSA